LNSPLLAAHPCENESAENTPPLAAGKFMYQSVNLYDKAANIIETRQSKGSGPSQVVTSATSYDGLGYLEPLAGV